LLFYVDQSSFYSVVGCYGLSFASYYYFIRDGNWVRNPYNILLYAAIVIRIIGVFAFPTLSDDLYRFVWDGRLSIQGYHPFEHLPSYYLKVGNEVEGITQELYDQLNSQDYYTIYPTISQWVFTFSAWLFPDSSQGFSISMKGILALMDIGTILVFRQILCLMDKSMNRVLLYAINPLVIIEICGNGHFEGAMIFFLATSFYFFLRDDNSIRNLLCSAFFFAAAVASKMLPLMFLPLLLAIIPWRRVIQFYVFTGLFILILFAPMMSMTLIEHLGESLNLYFQKFEFNASVYYIVRWVGYQVSGWNIIQYAGPILGFIVFIAIWILTYFNNTKKKDWFAAVQFPRLAMWTLTIYLSLATIVHPWYITTLVALSIFTSYRFPLLWSGLVTMTYINYSYDPYFENLWVVGLEYLLVFGMLIYEIKKFNFTNGEIPSGGISFKVKATNSK